MLKTSVEVRLQEVREGNVPVIYQINIPLCNACNMLLLLRSLYYQTVDCIKMVDTKTKLQLFLKYGNLAYHADDHELFFGVRELEPVERLLLDYISNTYFLGLHIDLEVPAGKRITDFTITIQV